MTLRALGMIWTTEHKLRGDTLSVDSTQLDVHYRSRHYEQRCRHHATHAKNAADSRRSHAAKRYPNSPWPWISTPI